MKKILLALTCLFILTGCDNAKMNPTQTVNYDSEYYEVIGMEKFKEVYANEEATFIYFGSEGCSACLSFKDYAKKFAKENEIKVYFVLLDNLSEEEYDELGTIVSFAYIPYITVYKNKEMLYGIDNVLSDSDLKSLALEYGVTR